MIFTEINRFLNSFYFLNMSKSQRNLHWTIWIVVLLVSVFNKTKNSELISRGSQEQGFNFKCILLLADIKMLEHSQNMFIEFFFLLGNTTGRLKNDSWDVRIFILCRFVLQRRFGVIQTHVLCKHLFKYFIESILCIFVMERYKGHLQHSCLYTSVSAKLFGMSEHVLAIEMIKMIPEFTTHYEHR